MMDGLGLPTGQPDATRAGRGQTGVGRLQIKILRTNSGPFMSALIIAGQLFIEVDPDIALPILTEHGRAGQIMHADQGPDQ